MRRFWPFAKSPVAEEDEPFLDQVMVHEVLPDDNSIKNRYLLEKQSFLATSREEIILYPRESKFTLTDRDIITEVFHPLEFQVSFQEVYFSNKKQKCLIKKPNDDFRPYVTLIEAFLKNNDSEKLILEKTGQDIVELKNYILYYYHKLTDLVPAANLEARYRMVDLETIHSVVLVVRE